MTFYIYIYIADVEDGNNVNCLLNISKYLYITIYKTYIYYLCIYTYFIAECIYIYIVFKKIKK